MSENGKPSATGGKFLKFQVFVEPEEICILLTEASSARFVLSVRLRACNV